MTDWEKENRADATSEAAELVGTDDLSELCEEPMAAELPLEEAPSNAVPMVAAAVVSVEEEPSQHRKKKSRRRRRSWWVPVVAVVLTISILLSTALLTLAGCVGLVIGGVGVGVGYVTKSVFEIFEIILSDEDWGGEEYGELPNSGSNSLLTPPDGQPDGATLVKLPSLRKDADGDGVADLEWDKNGEILTSAGDQVYSTATVCNMVLSSVVEIATSSASNPTVQSGAGSGVIIAPEGYIITNNHVVEDAANIWVRLTDGSEYAARLVGRDARTDIAVIWIDVGNKKLNVATMGSSFDLVVGEPIVACGNPLGTLGGTMTEGIISATERDIWVENTSMTLLQISAPINPGNSGGGLFNMAGHLVGIVNAKSSAEGIEGLGFAIPIDKAYYVAVQLIQDGKVTRAGFGIMAVEMSDGVYVSSATNEDFLEGDRLISVDGRRVSTFADIDRALAGKSVGDVVQMVVYRDGSEISFKTTLRLIE